MSSRTDLVKMGKHIQEARKNKKYTQKELGEIIDVSHKTISKWEQGHIAPDITILKSLAEALDMDLAELLSGEKVGKRDIEKHEEITINAIDLYSKNTKKRISKFFIILIAILFFISGTIYVVDRYYRWDVKEVSANGDFYAHGYIISNRKETKYIVDKIEYKANNVGTNLSFYLKKMSIKIKTNNNYIDVFNREMILPVEIGKSFSDMMIIHNSNYSLDNNKICLILEYVNSDNESNIVDIEMK